MYNKKVVKHLETKTGQASIVQTMVKEDTRFGSNETVELVYSYGETKDFHRLTFARRHSPCWLSVSLEKIKNNRCYENSFEMNKKQLEELIINLQALNETLGEHADTQVITE